MKAISEMTLEELQDHAIGLEEQVKQAKEQADEKDAKINELNELNATLQKRNNDLFMKVEQQVVGAPTPDTPEDKKESCEDFAKNLIKEGKI